MTVEEMKAFMQEEMRTKNAHDMLVETIDRFKDLPHNERYAVARTLATTFKRIMEEQV